ncbi:transcription elongation factor spt5 [Orbilia oligospora]|uniref:Transcription elongation factor SPT5 n=2 Tax=Orbilia oligospora TaxID=2813651 RepID=A0A7C8JMH5_ORBOL|nr:transcription elongation factor spt5 [Orbilia oligospora]KAF3081686.1 transcription elongation factor spt5 [Orbilia oligospora]KAF3092332.1 transcription elongation factor spt5 [Orbilia oligospora]KAF3131097.1 transcription elongation factor spt5 [Orbilia oligospora]KAF3133362.1 transcription elongation factor spt5 [Orbilia oligospora]
MSNIRDANLHSDEEEDDDFGEEEEDPRPEKRQRRAPSDDEDDEDDDDEDAPKPSGRDKSRNKSNGANEDDEIEELEEDEDDDDDDEDDDEDDDDEGPRRRRGQRRAHNPFLDTMAEVDEDDEVDDEEDDEMEADFIAPGDDDDALRHRAGDDRLHRQLDRQNQADFAEDLEKVAAEMRDRHGGRRGHRLGDASTVTPKRLLLPSVNDPSIWGVKCKPGKEKEAVFTIMKKVQDMKGTRNALNIISVLERGQSMQGFIYVEARRQADVLTALTNIPNVYARSGMILVPVDEMPDLLRVQKKAEITPGTFVRFKRGKYQGDLAQVVDVEQSGQILNIRAVPRIDYGARDDGTDASGKRKRAVGAVRPPQRLFSEAEARKYHERDLTSTRRGIFNFQGDTYEGGYLVKDVRVTALQLENVNPKLEEVTKFASTGDGNESLDLQALSQSLKASTDKYAPYQPGDMVEVYAGEQAGMVGKVTRVRADIVSMNVQEGPLKGKDIDVPFKGLRKRFKEGDHVKVMGGSRYRDEVGMVVKIVDDRVTFLSDLSMGEITVFSRDLREASDSGGMGTAAGKYDLWDLIQLNATTVACVIKIDRESLKVLDQEGATRTILPSQVAAKIPPRRKDAVATDRNGSDIRVEDTVKEIAGGENRSGVIHHLYRGFAFIHSKELQGETGGIFVARTNNLATMIAKGGRVASSGPDLSKMPEMSKKPGGNMAPPIIPRQGGRDRILGQTVHVRQGPYKGLLGIVKDATDTTARIELHSKNKTITIEKMKLGFKEGATGRILSYAEFVQPKKGFGDRGSSTSYSSGNSSAGGNSWSGSRTPAGSSAWAGSRTPAGAHGGSGGGGRTPAWAGGAGDGGRTPAWASGSKTPAYGANDGSRTSDPYKDGSRTSNPYRDGSRTSDPYRGDNDGSRTSYGQPVGASGGRTPAWNPGNRTPHYGSGEPGPRDSGTAWDSGSKTPARSLSSVNDQWNDSYGNNSSTTARTPAGYSATSPEFSGGYTAATPGASGLSAPTPGGLSAPTPPVSAPTPRANTWDAPTPGGPASAATPGASGGDNRRYFDAPTPQGGGYSSAKTPGAWGNDDDDDAPGYN